MPPCADSIRTALVSVLPSADRVILSVNCTPIAATFDTMMRALSCQTADEVTWVPWDSNDMAAPSVVYLRLVF